MRAVADQGELQRVDCQIGDAMANHAAVELSELQRRRKNIAVAPDDELGNDDVERARIAKRERALDRGNAEGTQGVVRGYECNEREEIVCRIADRRRGDEQEPRADGMPRSEERRVGKECRSRWSP